MKKEMVCPWWIGYVLACPLRKLIHNPEKILSPFVTESMKVLEIGPGMGFFTIPMARMVGKNGRIYAVDIQKQMLNSLDKRAQKAGVADTVECRLVNSEGTVFADLEGKIDFTLLMAVVHEIPDSRKLFGDVFAATKNGGKVLIAEPAGHVSKDDFNETIAIAVDAGFKVDSHPSVNKSLSVVLVK